MSHAPAISVEELRGTFREVFKIHAMKRGALGQDKAVVPDIDLWKSIADLGWLGIAIPESSGGSGLGFAHTTALLEEAGAALAAVPLHETIELAGLFSKYGNAEQKERWLGPLIKGDMTVAMADPVRHGPNEPASQAPKAQFDYLHFADSAALIVLPVEGGLAIFERGSSSVTVCAKQIVDLTRSMAEVALDPANYEPIAFLRLEPSALAAMADRMAVAVAADSIGGASAIFSTTLDYLKLREQFGRPIGSFQALKHRAADWKVQLEAANGLVRHAAASIDSGGARSAELASKAKYYACDVYTSLCEDAIQLHGGIGFTWDHCAHVYLKRARLNLLSSGDSRWHRDRISELAFNFIRP